ncbi:hypothetical protein LRP49_02360 [Enterovibrio sp. ZSDZ35]|uniref:Uncharacterized protein n=1 Tax=Enterovibrio qingdaonensis TaxID=2899818 RepID=A0ABT5QI80_9GAMM|nr:hypothetical protein [Enterovibrio sp. ZSDZ35]MDD1780031.1 hypothetical protein [Enterovibrio sp. ZSDZ35]
MHHILKILPSAAMLTLATSLYANALDLENLKPPVWLYENGSVVPQAVLNEISHECGIEEAATKVANAKAGEAKPALEALIIAAECFNAYGFKRESALPQL